MIDATLVRFVLVGAGNTVLGLSAIYTARLAASEFVANLLGYLIVVPISFITHRGWTFRDGGAIRPAFRRYLPAVIVGYAINAGVLTTALAAHVHGYIAQALAIAAYVAVTYLLSRYAVFRTPREQAR
jgi:putative flippase GtrA